MEQKYCNKCNATKISDEFHDINKYCIRCLEKERDNYRRNKEKKQEQKQKYYVEHKEDIKEQHRKYNKEYRQIEVWCDICKCKVKKCRASKHLQTQKHINNEKQKKEEEEKLSKMTDEEKDEYLKVQKLQKILQKVRPYFRS